MATVTGKGGCTATPHADIDPVGIACCVVLGLQYLVARETGLLGSAVTFIRAGATEAGKSTGEEQEAAVRQVHENLTLLEAELREGAFKGRPFFGGDQAGFLNVVLRCGSCWLAGFEEVNSVQLVDAELFHAWLHDFEAPDEVRTIVLGELEEII